jgi:hypothetical protein
MPPQGHLLDNRGNKQAWVSRLVFIGLGIIVVSIFVFFASAVLLIDLGKVLALLLAPIGIVAVAAGLISGWAEAFGDPSKRPVQRESGAYVIAKVVSDKRANPVVDPEFHDPEDLRYLVQFEFQGNRKVELETAPEVFDQVGEGMIGDIVYQGRWLSQFTFVPRSSERPIGEDPFRAGKL